MTSGGKNFNDFPDNQLTKFRVFYRQIPDFYPLLKFLWSIALRSPYRMDAPDRHNRTPTDVSLCPFSHRWSSTHNTSSVDCTRQQMVESARQFVPVRRFELGRLKLSVRPWFISQSQQWNRWNLFEDLRRACVRWHSLTATSFCLPQTCRTIDWDLTALSAQRGLKIIV